VDVEQLGDYSIDDLGLRQLVGCPKFTNTAFCKLEVRAVVGYQPWSTHVTVPGHDEFGADLREAVEPSIHEITRDSLFPRIPK
jgi:hypothetical protein